MTFRPILAACAGACFSAPAPASPAAMPTRAAVETGAVLPSWRNLPLGGGGYITGLVFHPREPGVVYLRTDVGGAYRRDHFAGRSVWTPLLDFLPAEQEPLYSVDGLAIDPSDPEVLYLALGHSLTRPGAVLVSHDRGASFRSTGLSLPFLGNGPRRWCGERLLVDPLAPSRLYVGSRTEGLWLGLREEGGDFRWNRLSGVGARLAHIHTVVADPQPGETRTSRLYAAGPEGPTQRSDDGGDHWRDIGGPAGPHRLAVDTKRHLWSTSPAGVHRYDPEAGIWHDLTPRPGQEYAALALEPPSTVCVAENRRGFDAPWWVSEKSGAPGSWRRLAADDGSIDPRKTVPWHPRRWFSSAPSAAAFDPFQPGHLWFTDWYTVWRSTDLRTTPVVFVSEPEGHEELVNLELAAPAPGARETLVYSGHADVGGFAHRDDRLYPETSFISHSDERLLVEVTGIAPATTSPSSVYLLGANCWQDGHHGEVQRGGLFFSADEGRSVRRCPGYNETWKWGRVAVGGKGIASVVVVSAGGGVQWSADGGESFSPAVGAPASKSLGISGHIFNRCHTLSADLVDEGRYHLLELNPLRVWQSVDGGRTWTVRSVIPGVPAPDTHESDPSIVTPPRNAWLIASPDAAGELWLASRGRLWRLPARSAEAVPIGALEGVQALAVGAAVTRGAPSAVYVFGRLAAADHRLALLRSTDRGERWERVSDDRQQLGKLVRLAADRSVPGRVFVGTGGRGVLVGNVGASPQDQTER